MEMCYHKSFSVPKCAEIYSQSNLSYAVIETSLLLMISSLIIARLHLLNFILKYFSVKNLDSLIVYPLKKNTYTGSKKINSLLDYNRLSQIDFEKLLFDNIKVNSIKLIVVVESEFKSFNQFNLSYYK
jgi:hypothetical protein